MKQQLVLASVAFALFCPLVCVAQSDTLNRYVTSNASMRTISLDQIPSQCFLELQGTQIAFGFGIRLTRVVPGESFEIVIRNMPSFYPQMVTHAAVDVYGTWPWGVSADPANFNFKFTDGTYSGAVTALGAGNGSGGRPATLPTRVRYDADLWGHGGFTSSSDRYYGGGKMTIKVEIPTLGGDAIGSKVQYVEDVRMYFVFGTGTSQVVEMGKRIATLGLTALVTGF